MWLISAHACWGYRVKTHASIIGFSGGDFCHINENMEYFDYESMFMSNCNYLTAASETVAWQPLES